jgi:hypothetical protein
MRLWTWSSGRAGFYVISMNYFRIYVNYLRNCAKNQNRNYGVHPTREGFGCWTGGLTDART